MRHFRFGNFTSSNGSHLAGPMGGCSFSPFHTFQICARQVSPGQILGAMIQTMIQMIVLQYTLKKSIMRETNISADPSVLQGERVREKVSFRSAAGAWVRSFAISGVAFSEKVGSESDVRHFGCLPRAFRSLALNPPRHPCWRLLQPSGCPAHHFGHLPGACPELF